MFAIKADKDYLIDTKVVVEMDCFPILGMISRSSILDLSMLKWIPYIKLMNLEVCHILGKNNVMADMLLRVRYEGKSDMVSEDEDDALQFFKAS